MSGLDGIMKDGREFPFVDAHARELVGTKQSVKWELLSKGTFGAAANTRVVLDLLSFEKTQYLIVAHYNKTDTAVTPTFWFPYLGSTMAYGNTKDYALDAFVIANVVNEDLYGYGAILHGWGETPQGNISVFGPNPRGMTSKGKITVGAYPFVNEITAVGTYELYGR